MDVATASNMVCARFDLSVASRYDKLKAMKVFIIAAVTADGFIGRGSYHTADWTSAEDKKTFVRLTKEAGVMVMGSRTFSTIGRALPGRMTVVYTSRPDDFKAQAGVEPSNESPPALVARLKSEGAHALAVCGGASVYSQFMKSGVVDELYLTVEPKLFGTGLPLFSDELDCNLGLLNVEKLNEHTVLLHYTVRKD